MKFIQLKFARGKSHQQRFYTNFVSIRIYTNCHSLPEAFSSTKRVLETGLLMIYALFVWFNTIFRIRESMPREGIDETKLWNQYSYFLKTSQPGARFTSSFSFDNENYNELCHSPHARLKNSFCFQF
jgi:hypothetical protein